MEKLPKTRYSPEFSEESVRFFKEGELTLTSKYPKNLIHLII